MKRTKGLKKEKRKRKWGKWDWMTRRKEERKR